MKHARLMVVSMRRMLGCGEAGLWGLRKGWNRCDVREDSRDLACS